MASSSKIGVGRVIWLSTHALRKEKKRSMFESRCIWTNGSIALNAVWIYLTDALGLGEAMVEMSIEKSHLEDFKVGEKTISPGRTVAEADIVMFAGISGDWNELHTNTEYMKDSPFGQRIAHGMLTLSMASGLALRARQRQPFEVLAFLGMDNVRFTGPVFIGDTIRVESEVIEARPSKSRTETGILKFKNTVKNQRDEVVATWENVIMVPTRAKEKKH
jgi:3-hydroxybutyryl-CoA dehydratase